MTFEDKLGELQMLPGWGRLTSPEISPRNKNVLEIEMILPDSNNFTKQKWYEKQICYLCLVYLFTFGL